jgi:predicted AlkP superfamily pyrophosphatase or phosphodiesterase
MKNKVILISIDGMRPDGFLNCKNPYINEMMKEGSYTLNARTVFPSVTLPCHMSMMHSVPPERHGITTNLYMPPVRPVNGIFEQAKMLGKKNAFFYGWEPLRDVARPLSCVWTDFIHARSYDDTDTQLADRAIRFIEDKKPDFVFLYMVETDEKGGHDVKWMSDTYLSIIGNAIEQVKKVREKFSDEYSVIVTADHGGHDRCHGTNLDEDMTIPMFFFGDRFEGGRVLENVSILDIAPTAADLLGVPAAPEWEGKSLAGGI